MSKIIGTKVLIEHGDMGLCEVAYAAYDTPGCPPALIMVQDAAPHAVAPITHNVPAIGLEDAIILQPKHAALAPQLVEAGILKPSEFIVLDMVQAQSAVVTDVPADILAAPVYGLADAGTARKVVKSGVTEPANPQPRAPKMAAAESAADDLPWVAGAEAPEDGPAEAAEEAGRKAALAALGSFAKMLGVDADLEWIVRATLKPGQTVSQLFTERNYASPAMEFLPDDGVRGAWVNVEACTGLNQTPTEVPNPTGFISLRKALANYYRARSNYDNASVILAARLLAALPDVAAKKAISELEQLDIGITSGLHQYISGLPGEVGELGSQIAKMREQFQRYQNEFDAALKEAGGDFQKAMVIVSTEDIPGSLQQLYAMLAHLKQQQGGDTE